MEGVVGLFDSDPSAAELAQHFRLPVVAGVIGSNAMCGNWRAGLGGCKTLPVPRFGGVLANRDSPSFASEKRVCVTDPVASSTALVTC
jgi:cobyrinic acid a,c-diamide synthase